MRKLLQILIMCCPIVFSTQAALIEQNQATSESEDTWNGQSFVWTDAKPLASISIVGGLASTAQLLIFDGDAPCATPSGSAIYLQSGEILDNFVSAGDQSSAFQKFRLTSAVSLVNGNSYTFCFIPHSASEISLAYAGNLYASGQHSTSVLIPTEDIAFQLDPPEIPAFEKVFSPAAIETNAVSTLTFTITNSNAFGLTGLNFTDSYPAGMINTNPLVVGGTCGSITHSAVADGGSFNLTGATIGASTTCTVSVQVTATTAGALVNTALNIGSTESGSGTDDAAATLTVITVPDAPTIGTGTPGDTVAIIAFTPPTNNGGAAITGYTASCGAGTPGAGTATPLTVTGLTNGTLYNCSVTATNSVGTSAASTTVLVTPATLPDAPTIGTGTPGDTVAIIAFTPPTNNGGAAITGYTASCGAGTPGAGPASPLAVIGLTNGIEYNCSITATNSIGTSAASTTVSVAPVAVNSTPVPNPPFTGTGNYVATTPSGEAIPATLTITESTTPIDTNIVTPTALLPMDIQSTSASMLPGYKLQVVMTLNAPLQDITGYWKYGPEPSNNADHWYDYGTVAANGDGTGYEISADGLTLTLYLEDGERGDDDLSANGTITDPGLIIASTAPPTPTTSTPIPTISAWGLGILAGLLGLMGFVRRRKA